MKYTAIEYISQFANSTKGIIGKDITLTDANGNIIVSGKIQSFNCTSNLLSSCSIQINQNNYQLSTNYFIIDNSTPNMTAGTRFRTKTKKTNRKSKKAKKTNRKARSYKKRKSNKRK